MKAQLSLEYILLFLISLVLISFSLISLNYIKEFYDEMLLIFYFKEDVEKIYSFSKSLCYLGDGNQFKIKTKSKLSIFCKDSEIIFLNSNFKMELKREIPCSCTNIEIEENNILSIVNENGKIVFLKS